MYKKYKRLVCAPPDLLARFCKVNLSKIKKIRPAFLFFYFGFPVRQRNTTYKLQLVNWLPPATIVSYNQPL